MSGGLFRRTAEFRITLARLVVRCCLIDQRLSNDAGNDLRWRLSRTNVGGRLRQRQTDIQGRTCTAMSSTIAEVGRIFRAGAEICS